jgi:hypothetical protein
MNDNTTRDTLGTREETHWATHACRGDERRSGDTTPALSLFLSAQFSHPSIRWLYTPHGATIATNTHTGAGLHAHLRMHIGDPSHLQATTRARLDLKCRCLVHALTFAFR